MKKLFNNFLIPTLLTSLTTIPIVPSCANNFNMIENTNNINKNLENIRNEALAVFASNWLFGSGAKIDNFQSFYRLNACKFEYLTYKNVASRIQQYFYEWHDIRFNIETDKDKENYYLLDGQNNIKIYISLFEKNEEWLVLCDFNIPLDLNNGFFKLCEMGDEVKTTYQQTQTFNNCDEFLLDLNNFLKKSNRWSDVTVELNETFFINSWEFYKNEISHFLCLDFKLGNCTTQYILKDPVRTFENENEFGVFIYFNYFLLNWNIQTQIGTVVEFEFSDSTYQQFADYLNKEIIDFKNLKQDNTYIKLAKNQNATFAVGKNILNLLIAKNKTCKEYIEYDLPIWNGEFTAFPYDSCNYFCVKSSFEKFNYPNNRLLENTEFKKGMAQKNAYDFLKLKLTKELRSKFKRYLHFKLINPDIPLKLVTIL